MFFIIMKYLLAVFFIIFNINRCDLKEDIIKIILIAIKNKAFVEGDAKKIKKEGDILLKYIQLIQNKKEITLKTEELEALKKITSLTSGIPVETIFKIEEQIKIFSILIYVLSSLEALFVLSVFRNIFIKDNLKFFDFVINVLTRDGSLENNIYFAFLFGLGIYVFKIIKDHQEDFIKSNSSKNNLKNINRMEALIHELEECLLNEKELLNFRKFNNEFLGLDENNFLYELIGSFESSGNVSMYEAIIKTNSFADAVKEKSKGISFYKMIEKLLLNESFNVVKSSLMNQLRIKEYVYSNILSEGWSEFIKKHDVVSLLGENIVLSLSAMVSDIYGFLLNERGKENRIGNANVLISGPPGTGKTQFNKNIIALLLKKIKGDEGNNLIKEVLYFNVQIGSIDDATDLMQLFNKVELLLAKEGTIVIWQIDEFDGLIQTRESAIESDKRKIATQFLQSIDDLQGKYKKNFVLLATTNYLKDIDSAAIRSGRFDTKFELDFISYDKRVEYIQAYFDKMKKKLIDSGAIKYSFLSEYDVKKVEGLFNIIYVFAHITEGFSNVDIECLINQYLSYFEKVNRHFIPCGKRKIDCDHDVFLQEGVYDFNKIEKNSSDYFYLVDKTDRSLDFCEMVARINYLFFSKYFEKISEAASYSNIDIKFMLEFFSLYSSGCVKKDEGKALFERFIKNWNDINNKKEKEDEEIIKDSIESEFKFIDFKGDTFLYEVSPLSTDSKIARFIGNKNKVDKLNGALKYGNQSFISKEILKRKDKYSKTLQLFDKSKRDQAENDYIKLFSNLDSD